jgi:hypothetical protein
MPDDLVEIWWMAGTLGDSRAPGPSVFGTDAVVTIEPELVQRGLGPSGHCRVRSR